MIRYITLVIMACGSHLVAQQNNQAPTVTIPPSSLIPGLPNDIAASIPLYIVTTSNSLQNCSHTLQTFSRVNKQWHAIIYKNKDKEKPYDQPILLELSKKFGLKPQTVVAWGKEAVENQLVRVNKRMGQFAYLQSIGVSVTPATVPGEYSYLEECLGHAIMQNNKKMVTLLCARPETEPNYQMAVDGNNMPLLAIAIRHRLNDNDLDIIDCLLKRGADPDTKFSIKKLIPFDALTPEEYLLEQTYSTETYTMLSYAQDIPSIGAKLKEYSKVYNHYFNMITEYAKSWNITLPKK